MTNHTIELLSPAKNLEAARAAVDYGADALYMGGVRYGARHAATNSIEDIARAVEYAHQYGVRVHATLNTVLYDDELIDAERQAKQLIKAGVDALIVQDMAYRQMNLTAELHASTQVGNTTPEGVKFLEQCGFSRVILERSLSLAEIQAIRAATNVELEYFVHGAICVGHSGRCFLSRSTSQRSGNRGECSQPCRLPYDLKDESGRSIINGKHLLSVRDLDLSASLEELIDAGISSFKIEGRLKDSRYIKNVVGYYRHCLDKIIARRQDVVRTSVGESKFDFTPNPAKSFTRGASQYMLYGKKSDVASLDTPKAIGEYIGRVKSLERNGFRLDRSTDLSAADGICVLNNGELLGTNINIVNGDVISPNRMEGIAKSVDVYRNYDHRFNTALDRSRTIRTIDAEAKFSITEKECNLTIRDCQGTEITISRKCQPQAASSPEKMAETAKKQIAKSGGTIFSITSVEVEGAENFIPASIISDMRREGLAQLRQKRIEKPLTHNIKTDDGSALYPYPIVSRYENVTNQMAADFYKKHGATSIEQALETKPTLGERVMISSYCIRREIGQCLKNNPTLRSELYLEHGTARYHLQFDCKRCEMSLVDCSKTNTSSKQP